jgi:hypothetical protein
MGSDFSKKPPEHHGKSAITDKIHAFIEVCDRSADSKPANILRLSLSTCLRYYAFLEIIRDRYDEVSKAYVTQAERAFEARKDSPDPRPVTEDELKEYKTLAELGLRLHLEIESFYIFAKILLDRIADTFAYYFDRPWKGLGSTHSKLTGQFKQIYAENKLEGGTDGFVDLLLELKTRIVEHRTDNIEHTSDPRLIHGTLWGTDKKAKITTVVLYPQEPGFPAHEQKQTDDLDELASFLEQYLSKIIDFFEFNRKRSITQKSIDAKRST